MSSATQIQGHIDNAKQYATAADPASGGDGDYTNAIGECIAAITAAKNAEATLPQQPSMSTIQNNYDIATQLAGTNQTYYGTALTAAENAQAAFLADNALPGGGGGTPPAPGGWTPSAALIALAAAMNTDPNLCNAPNANVLAFQKAYDGPGAPLVVDGKYGNGSDAANAAVAQGSGGGNVPAACSSYGPTPGPSPAPSPPPAPLPPPPAPIVPASTGMPTWAKWLIGLVILGGLVTIGTIFYRRRKKKGGHAARETPKKRQRRRKKK